jgi:two-component system sensor histidine kinase KdpD
MGTMPDSETTRGTRDGRSGFFGIATGKLARFRSAGVFPYLTSVGLVTAATAVAELTFNITSAAGLTPFFLVAVVIAAQRHGLWPAVFASFLGVLSWDYFFTVPYYSLEIDSARDIFALITFLIVALVVSGMTAQIRHQNERLGNLADSIAGLYRLSQEFSQLATVDELASFVVSRLSEMLRCETVVVLRDHGNEVARLVFPVGHKLEREEITAAEGIFFMLAVSNRLDRESGGRYAFLPLNALHGRIGSVGISRPDAPELTIEERQKLDAFLSQAALAVERAWLARDIEHAQMTAETERLRNALLTSVSHDLRTPLTTIIGALSTLKTMGESFNPEIRDELVSTARSEAERLNRFVGNLLDTTKLESGALQARLVPTDVCDVVEIALERARPLLARHMIEVALPPELPPVSADFVMLEQVVFNVLDNAAKYSPVDTKIEIRGDAVDNQVVVKIVDEGLGIPEEAREKLFEKFTRFAHGDSKPPGTGLGLMICRGFLNIMNGSITASNRTDKRGAVFTIRLQRASSE